MFHSDQDVVVGSRAGTGSLVAAMALLLAVASGCSGASGEEIAPSARLWFEPADATTNIGDSAITLLVDDPWGIVTDATLADLESHVVLQTWPEKTLVASTPEVDISSTPSRKVIRVVPNRPLEDRWYSIEVTTLPAEILSSATIDDPDTIGTRFRPGSDPRVTRIELCEKDAPGMKFVIQTSEPVVAELPAEEVISVAQNGAALSCELYWAPPEGGFYFTCPDLTLTSTQVTISAGLKAPTGATVPPSTWTIDVSSLSPLDSGCLGFRPPL